MPRQARIIIPNAPHHVTQRSNYRQRVFDCARHYKQYCEWVNDYAAEHNLQILAYCLMNNHVHFVVVPQRRVRSSENSDYSGGYKWFSIESIKNGLNGICGILSCGCDITANTTKVFSPFLTSECS